MAVLCSLGRQLPFSVVSVNRFTLSHITVILSKWLVLMGDACTQFFIPTLLNNPFVYTAFAFFCNRHHVLYWYSICFLVKSHTHTHTHSEMKHRRDTYVAVTYYWLFCVIKQICSVSYIEVLFANT